MELAGRSSGTDNPVGQKTMKELFYSIADEVFTQYPEYVRGVVLAYGVSNSDSSSELTAMLRAAEASVRDRLD